eukprot:4568247-Alexandrium_andersonii.AAC.1
MSASLVGSEMCIRDRASTTAPSTQIFSVRQKTCTVPGWPRKPRNCETVSARLLKTANWSRAASAPEEHVSSTSFGA